MLVEIYAVQTELPYYVRRFKTSLNSLKPLLHRARLA